MKKIIVLLVLFVFTNSFVVQENAYTTGEWFKLRIHYGMVNAGYATLEIKEAVKKIISTQATTAQRLDAADDVIENVGTCEMLKAPVLKLHSVVYVVKMLRNAHCALVAQDYPKPHQHTEPHMLYQAVDKNLSQL